MNKQQAKQALLEIYEDYKDRGLLSVYFYGSITEGSGEDAADVDSIGIVDDSFPLEYEDQIKGVLSDKSGIDDFGFRVLYKSELDGNEAKGTLTRLIHPKLLIFDFPRWNHVAGKKFAQSDFSLSSVTPAEALHLEMDLIKEWNWGDAKQVSSEKVTYYLKAVARLVHFAQSMREGYENFSYKSIYENANEEEKRVLDKFREVKSAGWDYNLYLKNTSVFQQYVDLIENRLKKKNRPYSVEPHNPQWALKFQKEREILKSILGDRALKIEHVGSTSVEDLWAKPQIDILVVVPKLEVVDDVKDELIQAGYNYQKSFDQFNVRYFTRDAPTGERLVSVHISPVDNERSLSAIWFRDYLRTHQDDRDLYSRVKRDAYEKGVDRVEYSQEKHKTLESIKDRARVWHEKRKSD